MCPHDALILDEFRDNVRNLDGWSNRRVFSFNEMLRRCEKQCRQQAKNGGTPCSPEDREDFFLEYYQATGPLFYQINKNGNVSILVLHESHNVRKIPSNILDLSDLKLLTMFMEIEKEKIPKTLKSTKKFDVQITPYNLNEEILRMIKDVNDIPDLKLKVNLDNLFELRIYKRELKDQIIDSLKYNYQGEEKIYSPIVWVMHEVGFPSKAEILSSIEKKMK